MTPALLMLSAWAIEATFGWPHWLFRLIRHPVVWFGVLVGLIERALNQLHWPYAVRYLLGALTSLTTIFIAVSFACFVELGLPDGWPGFAVEAVLASSLIASRSLYQHVESVARPLLKGEMDAARSAVSMIVGRNPDQLDEAGIARASIESLSENASDGVIAPLFWGALFGLPGIAGYKAVNTLDSIIGHKSERFAAFGGFAARLDDIANLIPARLTGFLLAAVSGVFRSFGVMVRDAGKHRSPNAGWPEAAMAGAIDVRLSGPRTYGDRITDEPWLNAGARDPDASDINRALSLYVKAMISAATLLAVASMLQAGL